MKELEENNNNYPDEFSKLSYKAKMYRIKDIYDKCETIEEKLNFVIQVQVYAAALAESGLINGDDGIAVAARSINNEFASKYVIEGNHETHKKVFAALGKIKMEALENQWRNVRFDMNNRFDKDDPDAYSKAVWLSLNHKDGIVMQVLDGVAAFIELSLGENDSKINEIQDLNITMDMTMKDVANYCGYTGDDEKKFFANRSFKPETKVIDRYKKYIPKKEDGGLRIVYSNLTNNLGELMITAETASWYEEAKKKYRKDNKISENKIEEIEKLNKTKFEGYPKGKAGEWCKTEGEKLAKKFKPSFIKDIIKNFNSDYLDPNISTKSAMEVKEHFSGLYQKGVSVNRYVELHTGINAVGMSYEVQKDMLAKAMAAFLIKDSIKKFDIDRIHTMADNIKVMPEFVNITSNPDKVKDYLANEKTLSEAVNQVVNATYIIPEENLKTYIERMKVLSSNMISSEGRSEEFKAFHQAVQKIAVLDDMYDINHEADKEVIKKDIVDINAKLIDSIRVYTKGKKSVRVSDNGKERFNCNLDALRIISDCIPGAKGQVDKLVNRINEVRSASNHVDLKDYGEKRALSARNKREGIKKPDSKTGIVM